MAEIGFIGTGLMGQGMAGRLLSAGHSLRVYNRTTAKTDALVAAGAVRAGSPAKAAKDADAVFAMLADDEASREVWLGPEGVLAGEPKADALCIECSTLSRAWVDELAKAVMATGRAYIDCPVTGYPHMAADGTMTLFVGAEPDVLARARPLLEPLCKEIMHFGPIGAGTAYKLTVNLMGAVQIAAAAEGLAMAERAGLDIAQVADAICKGAASSPQVIRNVRLMVDAKFDKDVTFTGRLRLKDTLYGTALAKSVGAKIAFGEVAEGLFRRLVTDGLGELSESKVIDVVRTAPGRDR
jgi:3-hydroxyisobutyrate dehydrogenase